MDLQQNIKNGHFGHMEHAHLVSASSPDTRCKVGCLIIGDGHILSSGYNHAIQDANIDWNVTEGKPKMSIRHAEVEALDKLVDFGDLTHYKKLQAVVTKQPCYECLVDLVSAGIKDITYYTPSSKDWVPAEYDQFVKENNVELSQYSIDTL